jgi:hypothetical protein
MLCFWQNGPWVDPTFCDQPATHQIYVTYPRVSSPLYVCTEHLARAIIEVAEVCDVTDMDVAVLDVIPGRTEQLGTARHHIS